MSEKRKQRGKEKASVVFPVADKTATLPSGYKADLKEIIDRISSTRLKTVLAANHELVLLYYDIGKTILQKQKNQGWGSKVIDRLSSDLRTISPI